LTKFENDFNFQHFLGFFSTRVVNSVHVSPISTVSVLAPQRPNHLELVMPMATAMEPA